VGRPYQWRGVRRAGATGALAERCDGRGVLARLTCGGRLSGRRDAGLCGLGLEAARAARGGGERDAGLRGKREGGSRAGLLAPGVGRELGFAGKEKGEAGWDAGFCYGFSFSISYFLFQTLLKPN